VKVGRDRERIVRQARAKFSGALANDTKWDELIEYFRGMSRSGWTPSWRSKWVNGHISDWDAEWFYHLPFPFVGVEWFDLDVRERQQTAALPPGVIDHSDEIRGVLSRIGFEFEACDGVARIWGYSPKSYEDFPPHS
jgi:hypothetical protein